MILTTDEHISYFFQGLRNASNLSLCVKFSRNANLTHFNPFDIVAALSAAPTPRRGRLGEHVRRSPTVWSCAKLDMPTFQMRMERYICSPGATCAQHGTVSWNSRWSQQEALSLSLSLSLEEHPACNHLRSLSLWLANACQATLNWR